MYDLYPFNAVMPINNLKDKYTLHNNFLHIKDKPRTHIAFKGDERIKHIIEMIDKRFLQNRPEKHMSFIS